MGRQKYPGVDMCHEYSIEKCLNCERDFCYCDDRANSAEEQRFINTILGFANHDKKSKARKRVKYYAGLK